MLIDRPVPGRVLLGGALQPRLRRPPAGEPGRQLDQPLPGVADHRERPVLGGIEARGVQRDQLDLRIAEHGPGAGGEVLEARADREHHVGLGGKGIGRGAADHAERPGVVGMIVGQGGAPGDGLDHRHAVGLGEGRELGGSERIVHAAACDDQWLVGLA